MGILQGENPGQDVIIETIKDKEGKYGATLLKFGSKMNKARL